MTTANQSIAITNDSHDENLKIEVASQWRLMWWKFKRHKLAMVSGMVVIILYIMAAFCEFFSPSTPYKINEKYVDHPPQQIHLFLNGKFKPFVFGMKSVRDPQSYKLSWATDKSVVVPFGLFVKGQPYKIWGLIKGDIHLFGPLHLNDPFFLMGSDKLGRDVLTRIIYSSRISLTVGLIGVAISLTIGILLGGLSGLVGGWLDNIIQRVIEIFISVPTLPV